VSPLGLDSSIRLAVSIVVIRSGWSDPTRGATLGNACHIELHLQANFRLADLQENVVEIHVDCCVQSLLLSLPRACVLLSSRAGANPKSLACRPLNPTLPQRNRNDIPKETSECQTRFLSYCYSSCTVALLARSAAEVKKTMYFALATIQGESLNRKTLFDLHISIQSFKNICRVCRRHLPNLWIDQSFSTKGTLVTFFGLLQNW
jgi:hypothetical protein